MSSAARPTERTVADRDLEPSRLMSMSPRQPCALPYLGLEADEFLLALGVAPISTSLHSAFSSMRACRYTPSGYTYT